MTQTKPAAKWKQAIPPVIQAFIADLEDKAVTALQNELPYHSIRIEEAHFTNVGSHAGRVLGWCISATTEAGWEYENTTCDRHGTMWVLFKNPYVFS